jgi:eukaryotic-like serine/threonine-protein kinase
MEQALVDRLLESLPELSVGTRLNQGGQKVVYSAQHVQWGDVVVKIVMPDNDTEKERALREIAFARDLNSPLFTSPFHCGEFTCSGQTVVYVIEEHLQGNNLRQILTSLSPSGLNQAETMRIVSALLDALELLEPRRLVHRDIKPENIIVSPARITLIDFGIARKLDIVSLTETYAIFGPMTPGYAPPEQIRNEKRKISLRTDLFSVGILAYECITGANPFISNARSPQEAVRNVLELNPPTLSSLGFHPSLDTFVFACIAKHPHRRPASIMHAKSLFGAIRREG